MKSKGEELLLYIPILFFLIISIIIWGFQLTKIYFPKQNNIATFWYCNFCGNKNLENSGICSICYKCQKGG